MLIVELDGADADVVALFGLVEQVCTVAGAREIQVARTEDQRARFWKGRRSAFAAMGRVSPNYYVQDGVIPRTKLARGTQPHSLARGRIGAEDRQRVPRR